jgi:hypothetical protein
MKTQDLSDWIPVRDIPSITSGKITRTSAKKLFQHRAENGLEARGGARKVGRAGLVHVPTLLDFVFGSMEGVQ